MILIFLVILIIAAVPLSLLVACVVGLRQTWKCGRKRLFWSQTAAVIVAVVLVAIGVRGFLSGFDPFVSSGKWIPPQMADLTGSPFSLGKRVYHYDSRSGNGDGYAISAFELTSEMERYFSAPPAAFFTSYPSLPGYESGGGWQLERWRRGPVKDEETKQVDFAFWSQERHPGIPEILKAVRRSLKKPTSLYAYYWRYPGRSISDIHLVVIDPEERRFYIIDSNT